MVLGSPGSQRIFSSMAQFISAVIDGGQSIGEAVERPRIHMELEGEVSLEAERIDPAVIEHLEARDYRTKNRGPFAFYLGAIQAVLRRRDGAGFQGVADVRRDGTAAGL